MTVAASGITAACRASFSDGPEPRIRAIADALVRHLHAFVGEIEPTREEWMTGIEFLTRVGHTCQGARQEFILLSDVLGVSMLVDTLNAAKDPAATESTVLGPFYVDNPPEAEQGACISRTDDGVPMLVDVSVTDPEGRPIPGAVVDIWEGGPDGIYDVQRGLPSGEHDLRARFRADEEGRVRCWAVVPVSYPVPDDGPVGELLDATGRHPWRPAHVHFRIAAEGFEPLVTHLFVSGDPYLTSDAVFGVKPSLIIELERHEAGDGRAEAWQRMPFTFVLTQA